MVLSGTIRFMLSARENASLVFLVAAHLYAPLARLQHLHGLRRRAKSAMYVVPRCIDSWPLIWPDNPKTIWRSLTSFLRCFVGLDLRSLSPWLNLGPRRMSIDHWLLYTDIYTASRMFLRPISIFLLCHCKKNKTRGRALKELCVCLCPLPSSTKPCHNGVSPQYMARSSIAIPRPITHSGSMPGRCSTAPGSPTQPSFPRPGRVTRLY